MDGGYPQTLIEDLLSEIKFTKTSLNSQTKTYKEEKEILPTLNVYNKGSLNNKNGIFYKTNHNFNKFLRNHQSFPYKKGKSLKDIQRLTKGFTPVQMHVRPVTRCIFSHNRLVSILAIIPAGCVLYNKCGQLSRQQLVPIYVIKQGDSPPKGN